MRLKMGAFKSFSKSEKRNMLKYIGGIMLYKFALETLNGCMSSIVLKRTAPSLGPNKMWTIMLSANYACQCIGSILVAPLVKRYKTNFVLSMAVLTFGLLIGIVPILEGATGGGRASGIGHETNYSPGEWNPMILFAIYPASGLFYGMVELIRRVIPSDIVGTDEIKLRKMDSLVHIFYETTGTAGALLSAFWIAYFNYGYSLVVIPVFFTLACLVWRGIRLEKEYLPGLQELDDPPPLLSEVKEIIMAFLYSVKVGAKLVLGRRSLAWLVLAYSLPLVLHRYLENVLFAQYAATGLGIGSFQQRLVAGSNLGELSGAFFVFVFSKAVRSPLPWLRLDAITLAIVWVFPLVDPLSLSVNLETWIWCLFPVMLCISFGWAAGDCSLVAYIQSRLASVRNNDRRTSSLSAVMAFLYVLYIVLFAIISPVMGTVLDNFLAPITEQYGNKSPIEVRLPVVRQAMVYTAGVFMTCCAVVILAATFIPSGSLAFNPMVADDEILGEVKDPVDESTETVVEAVKPKDVDESPAARESSNT